MTALRGRYRLGVRTEDSQSSNTGSIPVSATKLPVAIRCSWLYFPRTLPRIQEQSMSLKDQESATRLREFWFYSHRHATLQNRPTCELSPIAPAAAGGS